MQSTDCQAPMVGSCDIGILTVIKVEHLSIMKAFDVKEARGKSINGRLYFQTTIYSKCMQRNLSVVIGNVGKAGLVPTTLRTIRFLNDFKPNMMILAGIAAGCKSKYKCGHVVWPKNILNIMQSEQVETGSLYRPDHHNLPAEVLQMMQTWNFEAAEFHSLAEKIHGKKPEPTTKTKSSSKSFRDNVSFPPEVDDCVIACGDTLVRKKGMFDELRKYDPQVRAFEMESVGMVLAIEDIRGGMPWIQFRGISDFGDLTKTNEWQPYAAAAAAAYARLFVQQGYNSELIATDERQKQSASKVESLANLVASEPVSEVIRIPSEAPAGKSLVQFENFENLCDLWRVGRDASVAGQLESIVTTEKFSNLSPTDQARVLKFTAEVRIEIEDARGVKELITKIEQLGGPTKTLVARLRTLEFGPTKGAAYLENPTNIEEWNLRMVWLINSGETITMLTEWETTSKRFVPDSESWRLHALAMICSKNANEAKKSLSNVVDSQRNLFVVRISQALVDYYSAISTAAPDHFFRLEPLPIPLSFVKRDIASLAALERSAEEFINLSKLNSHKTHLTSTFKHWHLASLGNHAARHAEAQDYCAELLLQNPSDAVALQWATSRNYNVDIDTGINRMASLLGIHL